MDDQNKQDPTATPRDPIHERLIAHLDEREQRYERQRFADMLRSIQQGEAIRAKVRQQMEKGEC